MPHNSSGQSIASRRQVLSTLGATGAFGLAGCLGSSSSGSSTITIGAMGQKQHPVGRGVLNAAKLAAKQLNNNGGILDRDIEVITKDTKGDPGTTKSVYQELTGAQNVDATMGIFSSEALLSLMPQIADKQTIHMSTASKSPEVPRMVSDNYEKYKYVFRAGAVNSHFIGEHMLSYAEEQFSAMGWDRVALLAEDYAWTQPIYDILNENLDDIATVPVTKRVAKGTSDFTPIYDEVESNDVDGAFVIFGHIGATALTQWKDQQRDFGFGGMHAQAIFPPFYQSTSGAPESVFSHTPATPQSQITEKTVPWAEAYKSEYGNYGADSVYPTRDAFTMLQTAAEEAGSFETDPLISALESISTTGTQGQLEFYPNDHEFAHDVKYGEEYVKGVTMQWQDENMEVIWPGDTATSEYTSPSWL